MALEKFHHTLPTTVTTVTPAKDGVAEKTTTKVVQYKLVLPKYENLPFGLIRKFRKLGEAEQLFSLLEAILTEKDLEALDGAAQSEVGKMMTAWQKDAGIELGES